MHTENYGQTPPDSQRSDAAEGERRKQAQLKNHEARRERYVLQGRRGLLLYLLDHGCGTADAVYAAVKLPPGIDPRCLGSVPGMLARAGIIRRVGFVKSARPNRHASILQVWELIDQQAALDWLDLHREPPDDPPDSTDAGFSNPSQPPKNDDSRQSQCQRQLPGIESAKGDSHYG